MAIDADVKTDVDVLKIQILGVKFKYYMTLNLVDSRCYVSCMAYVKHASKRSAQNQKCIFRY
jgi:hypothetical protein